MSRYDLIMEEMRARAENEAQFALGICEAMGAATDLMDKATDDSKSTNNAALSADSINKLVATGSKRSFDRSLDFGGPSAKKAKTEGEGDEPEKPNKKEEPEEDEGVMTSKLPPNYHKFNAKHAGKFGEKAEKMTIKGIDQYADFTFKVLPKSTKNYISSLYNYAVFKQQAKIPFPNYKTILKKLDGKKLDEENRTFSSFMEKVSE